jgi:hypothetical protein
MKPPRRRFVRGEQKYHRAAFGAPPSRLAAALGKQITHSWQQIPKIIGKNSAFKPTCEISGLVIDPKYKDAKRAIEDVEKALSYLQSTA